MGNKLRQNEVVIQERMLVVLQERHQDMMSDNFIFHIIKKLLYSILEKRIRTHMLLEEYKVDTSRN